MPLPPPPPPPVQINSVICPVGQQTTLTIQYSGPLDAPPTAAVTGGGNLISVGPVTSNGNNSYSVVVTVNQDTIGTVTWTGSSGGLPVVNVSGPIVAATPATILTITGPTSPAFLDRDYTYTITANGMIDTVNPSIVYSKGGGSTVYVGTIDGVPGVKTATWTVPISFGGNANGITVVISAMANVNGQPIVADITVTPPTPTVWITPNPLGMANGTGQYVTITTNFTPSDPPVMSASSTSTPATNISCSSLTPVSSNQWTSAVTNAGSGTGTISATTVYSGTVVNTQINVTVTNPPTATQGFSPPTNPGNQAVI